VGLEALVVFSAVLGDDLSRTGPSFGGQFLQFGVLDHGHVVFGEIKDFGIFVFLFLELVKPVVAVMDRCRGDVVKVVEGFR